jgi:glycogen synthase
MNVAIFASAYHPHVGGVEELVRQLAHALQDQGHLAYVFTNRWPKNLPAIEEHEGITVYRHVFRVPERSPRQMVGARLLFKRTADAVCRQLMAAKTDVLHVQCVSSNAHYALEARHRLGLPLVVTLQGELTMDAGGIFQHSEFARNLLRRALSEADAITACSAQTLGEAEDFYGQPFAPRGHVIYNGVRLSDFVGIAPHEHPRPYLLAIGRHVPQKGFDVLLRAFAMALRRAGIPHDLLLAGDGTESATLQELAKELGVSERVVFTGRADRRLAMRLFAGCDFFALPSRHEPFGIVNVEAMAAGKAVIASRVGGVPEIIADGRNGLLVPPDDPVALADAILRLACERDLPERLGSEGRAGAAAFDWLEIAARYAEVYRTVSCRHPMTGALG